MEKNIKTATATTVHFHFVNICLLTLFSSEIDNYALVIRTPPNPFRGVLMNYVAKFSKRIYVYIFFIQTDNAEYYFNRKLYLGNCTY